MKPFFVTPWLMKVALFGATGFVGGYLVDTLLAAGHEPSVLVRPGSLGKLASADRCRVTGGALADKGAVRAVIEGCEAVIYDVGLLREFPRKGITFEEAHFEGVRRTAEIARAAGIERYLLMSANGVDACGTPYQETKFRAERLVRDMGLAATVFRPSVIFGDPAGKMEIATQLYRDLVRPPIPAAGFHTGLSPHRGQVLMTPVHAADVAAAFVAALEDETTIGRTLELGGPESVSWSEMIRRVAAAVGRRKIVLPVPIGLMRLAATAFDRLPFFPVTRDQLAMLAQGNTARPDALEALIGRKARAFSPENLGYLLA